MGDVKGAEGRHTLASREDYVHFVEVLYFGKVREADHEAVVSHFAPGATLTGYMGDAPARIIRKDPQSGESSLDDFMKFGEHVDLTYRDFVHYVDLQAERVASHFTLLMVPKPGGAMVHLPARRMQNCNFFQFKDGLLIDVIAYFANPGKAES